MSQSDIPPVARPHFALHPGTILSKNDNDRHYICYAMLMQLYGLKPAECVEWNEEKPFTIRGRRWDDYVHLYPSYHGDCMLFDKQTATEGGVGT